MELGKGERASLRGQVLLGMQGLRGRDYFQGR